jgi:hypothetical protein
MRRPVELPGPQRDQNWLPLGLTRPHELGEVVVDALNSLGRAVVPGDRVRQTALPCRRSRVPRSGQVSPSSGIPLKLTFPAFVSHPLVSPNFAAPGARRGRVEGACSLMGVAADQKPVRGPNARDRRRRTRSWAPHRWRARGCRSCAGSPSISGSRGGRVGCPERVLVDDDVQVGQ